MEKEEKELLLELEHEKENTEQAETELLNFEHGDLSTEEAFEHLAKATGKTLKEAAEIWQRGCEAEELEKRAEEAEKDSEVFEKLAEIRGISKNEMKEEILWALEKAQSEKLVLEIMEQNPGMNRSTAEELARFRLGMAKKAKPQKTEEDWGLKLCELDEFLESHSGEAVEKLAAEVVQQWQRGIPLKEAFEKFELAKQNAKLCEEMQAIKAAEILAKQKAYAKEHSPGSAASNAESAKMDDFAAGLFREY